MEKAKFPYSLPTKIKKRLKKTNEEKSQKIKWRFEVKKNDVDNKKIEWIEEKIGKKIFNTDRIQLKRCLYVFFYIRTSPFLNLYCENFLGSSKERKDWNICSVSAWDVNTMYLPE